MPSSGPSPAPAAPAGVARRRLGRGSVRADRDDGAQGRIEPLDAGQVEGGQFGRGQRSGRQRLAEIRGGGLAGGNARPADGLR